MLPDKYFCCVLLRIIYEFGRMIFEYLCSVQTVKKNQKLHEFLVELKGQATPESLCTARYFRK